MKENSITQPGQSLEELRQTLANKITEVTRDLEKVSSRRNATEMIVALGSVLKLSEDPSRTTADLLSDIKLVNLFSKEVKLILRSLPGGTVPLKAIKKLRREFRAELLGSKKVKSEEGNSQVVEAQKQGNEERTRTQRLARIEKMKSQIDALPQETAVSLRQEAERLNGESSPIQLQDLGRKIEQAERAAAAEKLRISISERIAPKKEEEQLLQRRNEIQALFLRADSLPEPIAAPIRAQLVQIDLSQKRRDYEKATHAVRQAIEKAAR